MGILIAGAVVVVGLLAHKIAQVCRVIFYACFPSFYHPSHAETEIRSRLHDKVRYLPWSPLLDAALFRQNSKLRHLLNMMDVNYHDVDQATALHAAALAGNRKGVKILLQKGAELESREMRGQTPLHWAARNGHHLMVLLLVQRGADVNARDDRGKTPLRIAAKRGHLKVVSTLVALEADIEARDAKLQTPYFVSLLQGRMEVARYFEAIGANRNVTNIDGKHLSQITGRASLRAYFRSFEA